ncbi:VOC family protein [Kribbella sp. NPDC048928]|uniref:VOC family protein n=1 Tax=Kribbella sp. NPDC048928 TaxID=3364111 RepID=UPI003721A4A5
MAEQQIKTFLMFEGGAEQAMNFYLSLFEDAEIVSMVKHGAEGPGPEGSVMVAVFRLAGQQFMCSDSYQHHGFTFTPSMSFFVDCADEAELERLYNALVDGGGALMPLGDYGFSKKFGWVNDRFGVSWQLNLPHA